jgi:hypothetical protein
VLAAEPVEVVEVLDQALVQRYGLRPIDAAL